MKKRYLPTLLGVFLLTGGVIAYNYWAFSSGRCTLATFFSLSSPAIILILCNLVAFLVLCAVRTKTRHFNNQSCVCGNLLHPSWHYCPCCGAASSRSTAPDSALSSF